MRNRRPVSQGADNSSARAAPAAHACRRRTGPSPRHRSRTRAPAAPAASSPAWLARPPAARAPTAAAKSPEAAADRLELGTATVTGDREQPKVMYIVPWKRSDIGDLAGKPMNSLVDEILAPVDRDVFKREVVYYGAVQADASQNGAADHAGAAG